MAANNSNTGNKSLYLYTALIFVVAILLIILSFFAMSNRDNKMNESEQTQSITERASVLSEENKNLAEQNLILKEENIKLKDNLLNIAKEIYSKGDVEKANTVIMDIQYDTLSEEQQVIYNTITEQNAE